MRIGIGITTNNRPKLLKELLDSIHTFTDLKNCIVYVADDSNDCKGVAVKKNECLRDLKDCDHVFLLDDDVRILKSGWIENCINSGYDHLLYLNESHNKFIDCGDGSSIYADCGGVFMYMTKKAIDNVGSFNEAFTRWGFEHAEYSKRIALATKQQYNYRSLNNMRDFIFAHDYETLAHRSTITDLEKQRYFDENLPKFKIPIKRIFIPL